ncbi:hypothetical protein ACKVWM_011493 [Pyricularia oryzae]
MTEYCPNVERQDLARDPLTTGDLERHERKVIDWETFRAIAATYALRDLEVCKWENKEDQKGSAQFAQEERRRLRSQRLRRQGHRVANEDSKKETYRNPLR